IRDNLRRLKHMLPTACLCDYCCSRGEMMHSRKLSAAVAEALESRRMLSATPRLVGYFPDYRFTPTLLQNLNWSGLTQVNYFSIRPNPNGSIPASSSNGNDLTSPT